MDKSKLLASLAIVTVSSFACVSAFAQITTIAGCKPENYVQGEATNRIATQGSSYTPKCLRIKVGSTVIIQASQHHPLIAMPDINNIKNPFAASDRFTESQSRVMNTIGVFGYFCQAHGDAEGDGMAGAIIVEQ